MTTKDFFLKWNGIGLDADGAFGFQCVDIFKQFNKDVIGGPAVSGNAVDYWTTYPNDFYDKIANTPTNCPQEGDVMIWGTGLGQYGHIAICLIADVNHFISFDQNYPIGSLCHFQSHNYLNLLGWLHPKNLPQTVLTITDQTILPIIDANGNKMEVQAVRSILSAQEQRIINLLTDKDNLLTEIATLKLTLASLNASVSDLQTKLDKCTSQSSSEPIFESAISRYFYNLALFFNKK